MFGPGNWWVGSEVKRTNRCALPAHLPRFEMVIDIESKACPCCAGALHRIGEDVSERLDIIPAQIRLLITRRPKYACRSCEEGVVQAPAPSRLIEGGLPTEATTAHDRGQVRRPPPALSSGSDLRPARDRSGPLHPGRLDRPRRLAAAAGARLAP